MTFASDDVSKWNKLINYLWPNGNKHHDTLVHLMLIVWALNFDSDEFIVPITWNWMIYWSEYVPTIFAIVLAIDCFIQTEQLEFKQCLFIRIVSGYFWCFSHSLDILPRIQNVKMSSIEYHMIHTYFPDSITQRVYNR